MGEAGKELDGAGVEGEDVEGVDGEVEAGELDGGAEDGAAGVGALGAGDDVDVFGADDGFEIEAGGHADGEHLALARGDGGGGPGTHAIDEVGGFEGV